MNTQTVPMKPPAPDAKAKQETSCACPPSPNGGNKAQRNFFVEVATAVAFGSMVGTGILLKWVLPPGRFGGRGLTWLGLDRHAWGDVHLWLAFGLLALTVTHVVLHWRWVTSCWQRALGGWRSIRTWAVVGVLAVLMFLPLVVPSSQQAPGRGFGQGRGRALRAANDGTELVRPRAGRGGRARGMRGRRLRGIAAPSSGEPNVAPDESDDALDLGTELWEGDFGP
jgi:Domain of unknown function (DUF4405)